MDIIRVDNLQKTFAIRKGKTTTKTEAVKGVSFRVKQSEIFGLLGPNGAGKTTTMRMLTTLLDPTGGSVSVVGHDLAKEPQEIRKQIGYISQKGGLEAKNTGLENLRFQATMYGLDKVTAEARIKELVQSLELKSFVNRPVSTYSGGQRRRVDLAMGMIHKPKLLFMDEPSTGLDPQSRARVWEEVKKLTENGVTIFLTTHYLDEADNLCDRILIMDNGTIEKEGTPESLKAGIAGDIITFGFKNEDDLAKAKDVLQSRIGVREVHVLGDDLQLYVDGGEELLPQLIHKTHENGIMIKSVQLARPTLDDVFIRLTGRSMRDEGGKSE